MKGLMPEIPMDILTVLLQGMKFSSFIQATLRLSL